jgi:hypothetical protein
MGDYSPRKDSKMKNKIKELIYNLLKDRNDLITDFINIEEMLDKNNIDFEGDSILSTSNYGDIYFWVGMSQDFADAIIELKEEEKIDFEACGLGIYLLGGKVLKFPIVEKKQIYDKPHWLPVIIKLIR